MIKPYCGVVWILLYALWSTSLIALIFKTLLLVLTRKKNKINKHREKICREVTNKTNLSHKLIGSGIATRGSSPAVPHGIPSIPWANTHLFTTLNCMGKWFRRKKKLVQKKKKRNYTMRNTTINEPTNKKKVIIIILYITY